MYVFYFLFVFRFAIAFYFLPFVVNTYVQNVQMGLHIFHISFRLHTTSVHSLTLLEGRDRPAMFCACMFKIVLPALLQHFRNVCDRVTCD